VGEAYHAKRGPDENFPDFARRITYLIDPSGTIAKAWQVSDVKTHPDEILEEIRSRAGHQS
jgi:peroxiredoxin